MHLCRRKVHFVGVMIARLNDASQDVTHLGLIVDETQQGSAACALLADSKDVFGGRVERDNQQVIVEQDDARA